MYGDYGAETADYDPREDVIDGDDVEEDEGVPFDPWRDGHGHVSAFLSATEVNR